MLQQLSSWVTAVIEMPIRMLQSMNATSLMPGLVMHIGTNTMLKNRKKKSFQDVQYFSPASEQICLGTKLCSVWIKKIRVNASCLCIKAVYGHAAVLL
uniref:Uncharacterized protein n=1 Tax=Rhipicephalus zambeziensis TaxID=60191 RepID=A0A224YES5_9ACAR